MATALLEALGRERPEWRLSVLAKPWVADLFAADPAVTETVVYDPGRGLSRVSGLLTTAERVRNRRFDGYLLLPNSFETGLLAWLSGTPRRVGYARDGRGPLLTHGLSPQRAPEHQVRYYLRLAEGLEVAPAQAEPRLYTGAREQRAATAFLVRLGWADGPYAAFFPGAAYGPAKQWPAERFAAVGRELRSRYGLRILLLGAAGDAAACGEVSRLGGEGFHDMSGLLTLSRTLALTARSVICLANDSGGMHAAAALGVPTVGLFGPTSPEFTAPRGPRAGFLEGTAPCRPCKERTCPTAHACMLGIEPEHALAKAEELMHGYTGN